jgi:G3E family GTPase
MTRSSFEATTRRTPVLVVSGFLGSGKTTLVARLLYEAQRRGLRAAVISNELGELGIDRAVLAGRAYAELAGGCVCCELSDDLVRTLEELHQEVDPDWIVIETSGVALPYDTQLHFWRDPVRRWLGEDMAVVVVNAEQVTEARDLAGTFEDQVSSADLLVLNKLDLIAPGTRPAVEAKLRGIEPEAPIVGAVRGDVDPALFFLPALAELDRTRTAPPAALPHHHEEFETHELRVASGVPEPELVRSLESRSVLRAKGFVRTDKGLRLVQVVGRRVEISEPEGAVPDALVGRLVMIQRAQPGS